MEEEQKCFEIERLVRIETISGEHGKRLEKIDGKLDVLLEKAGEHTNNKGFIGGIASTGWLIGVLTADIVKPFVKPILSATVGLMK